ncbi:hypothetical protein SAMN05443633_101579 [Chryseobacterium arachidis]|uniref:Uncharacterized protein n=1 Tax=Chryseobacterium arachidis TaxID=1416778 RepID=A0A1M4URH0_9FLAO|nr:hypothetical protein [Chryseobacterium arachidis]SHE59279.1 hypothetical protein SAMN05443633_101579 [Chryseobacterium arachidis]
MKINCKNCERQLIKLNFTEEQKLHFYILMQNRLKLFAKNKIIDEHMLSENEADAIIDHLNKYGRCIECKFDDLNHEYVECPNCQAFNFNLKEPSFNIEFCSLLEWSLDFENSGYKEAEYFWCDGISHLPENTNSLLCKNIEKDREIITKAWIGNDGQDIYEMKIKFGKKSLKNYKNQKNLAECIPTHSEKPNWIILDVKNKLIELQLK